MKCLGLQVHHLAVNALLKSSQVNEMEGGALLGFSSDVQDAASAVGVQTSWDETVSCAPAFQVLKHMVQGWLSDAVSSGNVFADCLLQHLYRWLCRCTPQIHGVFLFFLTCLKEMSFLSFFFFFVSDLVERCYS
jgi:DNA polymerase epsilon subunit 1